LLDSIIKPQQRLTVWRNFKKQELSTEKIISYISSIKTVERTFDFYTPKQWPTCWEIVSNAMFCYSGKAILLHDTLVHMGRIEPKNINWIVVDNYDFGQVGLAFSDGLCYYNILPDTVVKIKNLDNYSRVLERINKNKLDKLDNESNQTKWTERRLRY
tara:strand:- start:94 stop:567 length:474 start_codon:yes stop_codon:yes gene_type:complete